MRMIPDPLDPTTVGRAGYLISVAVVKVFSFISSDYRPVGKRPHILKYYLFWHTLDEISLCLNIGLIVLFISSLH